MAPRGRFEGCPGPERAEAPISPNTICAQIAIWRVGPRRATRAARPRPRVYFSLSISMGSDLSPRVGPRALPALAAADNRGSFRLLLQRTVATAAAAGSDSAGSDSLSVSVSLKDG